MRQSAFHVVLMETSATRLRTRHERMRLWIPILSPYKVPIEGRHDRVRCALLDVLPLPLAYTSATSVCQDRPPSLSELGEDPISFQSSSYLL